MRRKIERDKEDIVILFRLYYSQKKLENNFVQKEPEKYSELEELTNVETLREQQIKQNKSISNRILHERNIYVFLASVAEESLNNHQVQLAEIAVRN